MLVLLDFLLNLTFLKDKTMDEFDDYPFGDSRWDKEILAEPIKKGKVMNYIVKLICGVPRSGKDFYTSTHGGTVVSIDNIRIEEYEKKYPSHGFDSITLYDKAWAYCN